MIWAYGPPRPGEQVPRGTAWDFSGSVFTISNEEIETDTRYLTRDFSLKILPNPFRNTTVIKFQIPNPKEILNPKLQIPNSPSPFSSPPKGEDWSEGLNSTIHNSQSEMSLRIYDVSGGLVRQWDYQIIGQSDQITWDGCDDTGKPLPSGIYFVKLIVDGKTITEKCVILKN